ncbi:hypothetical protein BV22DRAFT_1016383, partial [Leucogyrophana mollusca]
EGNIHYWASSLMDFTYAFVDHGLEKADCVPPFIIPRLRFVYAAIAVPQSTFAHGSTARAGYLIEEYIGSEEGPEEFVKYVHNGKAVPLLDPPDPLYYLAEFLCFTQHVQFHKTGHQLYLSDYQGTLLSTHSASDLFGEGNVAIAVRSFQADHQCNYFCKWFGLEPLIS